MSEKTKLDVDKLTDTGLLSIMEIMSTWYDDKTQRQFLLNFVTEEELIGRVLSGEIHADMYRDIMIDEIIKRM